MSATKTKVQSIIDENPVAVFSKSYCPYCRQAKELLSQSGAKFYAIELDQVGTFMPRMIARVFGESGCLDTAANEASQMTVQPFRAPSAR
jgi:glutaredoxin 3